MITMDALDEHYLIFEDTNKLKYNRFRSTEFPPEKECNEQNTSSSATNSHESSGSCSPTENNNLILNNFPKQNRLQIKHNNHVCECGCQILKEEMNNLEHEVFTLRKLVSSKRDMEAMDWFSPNIFEEKSKLREKEKENQLLRDEIQKLNSDMKRLYSRLEALEVGNLAPTYNAKDEILDPRNEAVVILGNSFVKKLNSGEFRIMVKDLPKIDEKGEIISVPNKKQIEKLTIHVGSKGVKELNSQLGNTKGVEIREMNYEPPVTKKKPNIEKITEFSTDKVHFLLC
ncbi:uncharacterized protein LOC116612464 isoform X2 [Nematostella vectensis]|uniref:uncharacterized protein LOC116612464 isoform X2 n=1 Tax=Nematostella vectensis TaxID=45351 RepID=UPI002077432A|nr:uncharacterized protein LOC116612464 isoform X2 [Nematostella vectensis]